MTLNNKSPRAIQLQNDTKIKLMPHQLASIYKMIQIENNRTYVYNNFQYDLNYGFLANEVGSGKSYIVLELCNYNLTSNYIYNKFHLNKHNICSGYSNKIKDYNHLNINVILVPHTLFHQWRNYITNYNCNALFIGTNKQLNEFDNYITNYYTDNFGLQYLFNEEYVDKNTNIVLPNIIIVKTTLFDMFQFVLNKNNIVINRLFIDEFLALKNIKLDINYNFTWIISSLYTNIYNKFHLDVNFIKNFSFIPDKIFNKIIVIVSIKFINISFNLPKINYNKSYYRVSSFHAILNGLSTSITRALETDSFNHIKSILNINQDNSLTIVQSIILQWEDELNKYGINSLPDIRQRIKITQKIEHFKNKIKEYECVICYSTKEDYIITTCCKSICCSECIICWIKENKYTCVICRTSLENTFNSYRSIENFPIGQVNAVIDVITNILINNSNAKIVVCSNYEESHHKIINYCKENIISFAVLNGNEFVIKNIIIKFNTGIIKILFLTADNGVGTNLECATDIILFDMIQKSKQNQLIGRCQRPGRTTNLNVHMIIKKL
jgi:hypothetical protein